MTTARSSPLSRRPTTAVIAIALAVLASVPAIGHRRDEYLQAARIAIAPDRLELQLDLTPGMLVASQMLLEIDGNGDGLIDAREQRTYAVRVSSDLRVDIDGRALSLQPVEATYPDANTIRGGEGTIALRWVAALPRLGAGAHRVSYLNAHHRDIGVYLANALVPSSDRVVIAAQRRDVDQRELGIEYQLSDGAPAPGSWRSAAVIIAVLVLAAGWLRSRLSVTQAD